MTGSVSLRGVGAPALLLINAILLLSLIIPLGEAGAQVSDPHAFMPLDVGNTWVYTGTGDWDLTVTVVGTQVILDRETFHLIARSENAVFIEQFLSWSADGDLLLHGRTGPGMEPAVFDPPLVWFRPGMDTGVGGAVTKYSDFEGRSEGVEATYYIAYMGDEEVATPAGSYATVRVDELNSYNDNRWYAEGVGLVQADFLTMTPFKLVSWDRPAPVEGFSWSDLKAMYR